MRRASAVHAAAGPFPSSPSSLPPSSPAVVGKEKQVVSEAEIARVWAAAKVEDALPVARAYKVNEVRVQRHAINIAANSANTQSGAFIACINQKHDVPIVFMSSCL